MRRRAKPTVAWLAYLRPCLAPFTEKAFWVPSLSPYVVNASRPSGMMVRATGTEPIEASVLASIGTRTRTSTGSPFLEWRLALPSRSPPSASRNVTTSPCPRNPESVEISSRSTPFGVMISTCVGPVTAYIYCSGRATMICTDTPPISTTGSVGHHSSPAWDGRAAASRTIRDKSAGRNRRLNLSSIFSLPVTGAMHAHARPHEYLVLGLFRASSCLHHTLR